MSLLETINAADLGARLKTARNAARVTQEEAANTIGVARTTIVAIEGGDRRVKSEELVKLAQLYKVSVNSLLRESAVLVDLAPQFRRSPSAKEDEQASLDAAHTLQKLASLAIELERQLGVKGKSFNFPEYSIFKAGWQDQAEDLASEVRQRMGAGTGPIANIFVLAEADLGIRLFVHRISSKISGAFAFQEEVGACILLNSVHPVERRVWTCAHEIAHFLTNRRSADVSWLIAHERGIEEKFADRFAAAFLMPASLIRLRFNEISEESGRFSPRNLVALASTFNVSVEAMARRLEQLTLLPRGTYESLVERGFSAKNAAALLGIKEAATDTFIPRLTWLVVEAYQKDLLTEAQAAEALEIDRLSLRKLMSSLLEEIESLEEKENG